MDDKVISNISILQQITENSKTLDEQLTKISEKKLNFEGYAYFNTQWLKLLECSKWNLQKNKCKIWGSLIYLKKDSDKNVFFN